MSEIRAGGRELILAAGMESLFDSHFGSNLGGFGTICARPIAQGVKSGADIAEHHDDATISPSTGSGPALPDQPDSSYGRPMRTQRLRTTPEGATMAVSDARRLQVYEQAREHWGDGPAEALMELVVPAGQDMATKADIERLESRMDDLATKEYVLRMLLITLIPIYLGIIGLYFTG